MRERDLAVHEARPLAEDGVEPEAPAVLRGVDRVGEEVVERRAEEEEEPIRVLDPQAVGRERLEDEVLGQDERLARQEKVGDQVAEGDHGHVEDTLRVELERGEELALKEDEEG